MMRRLSTIVLNAVVLAASFSSAAAEERLPAEQVKAIERRVQAAQERLRIPGLSVAIATNNQLAYAKGFGWSDIENRTPATAETLYRTASIAKPMTAVLALKLTEAKLLDLDEPVQTYYEFPQKKWALTTRQLLGHLGGVRHYRNPPEAAGKRHFRSVQDAIRIFAKDPLVHQPGEKFLYTTYGYNLAGAVVESAGKDSFHALLRQHVWEPAAMKRTRVDNHFAVIENRARGYIRLTEAMAKKIQTPQSFQVGDVINAEMHDTSMKVPGGGLLSTAPDLVRFAAAVNQRKLLDDESVKAMWTRQRTSAGTRTSYGLGWGVGDLRGVQRVSHGGAQAGVATYLLMLPEQGVAVAAMCNLQGVSLASLTEELAAIVGDVPAPVDLTDNTVGPAEDYAEIVDHLRPIIREQMKQKRIPAFSIALVDRDRIVWAEGFGSARENDNLPATAHTVYRMGSVSKLLTDVAVMQQVDRGALQLDEPIESQLPDFRPTNPYDLPITLRQLMSHRSGLVREPPVGHYFDPTEPSLVETVASLNETSLVYPPGKRTKYSNAAVAVAGLAVQEAAQQPYVEYMEEQVLGPLGMTSSSYRRTPTVNEKLSEATMWTYDGRRFKAPTFALGTSPAGNLYSSVVDLGRFLQFVFRGGRGEKKRALSAATLQSMLSGEDGQDYGIGFRLSQFRGEPAFGHGGAVYGFSTQLKGLPESRLGVVAVASLDGANGVVGRIADYTLARALAKRRGEKPPEFIDSSEAPREIAQRSAGVYQDGQGNRAQLYLGEDQTFLRSGVMQRELRWQGQAFLIDDVFGRSSVVRAPVPNRLLIGQKAYLRSTDPEPAAAKGEWKDLIGEYGWDHNVLYILEDGGQLYALIEWFFFYPLQEVERDVFAFPDYGLYHGEKLFFERDDEGAITRVVAAEVKFERRASTADGDTFKIKPLKSIDELRRDALAASPPEQKTERKPDLVDVAALDKTIHLDIRYATENNFMGSVFYQQPRAFLQRPAAEALVRAHRALAKHGYGVLIHDAYRPWFVTKMFWDATPAEYKDFVANPANGSRHNRGCAVDLTLYHLETGEPVQMVAGYDEFSPRAFPLYPGGSSRQRWLRDLLRRTMEAEGFRVYEYEWWHFDYQDWRQYPLLNQTFEQLDP